MLEWHLQTRDAGLGLDRFKPGGVGCQRAFDILEVNVRSVFSDRFDDADTVLRVAQTQADVKRFSFHAHYLATGRGLEEIKNFRDVCGAGNSSPASPKFAWKKDTKCRRPAAVDSTGGRRNTAARVG
jgi:hypothetical protein